MAALEQWGQLGAQNASYPRRRAKMPPHGPQCGSGHDQVSHPIREEDCEFHGETILKPLLGGNVNRLAYCQSIGYNRGMKRKVIFVCSANYYRSRYAEHYFNWFASQKQLDWKADSRGLMVGVPGNPGPISHFTLEALKEKGIPLEDRPRGPKPLTLADLADADLVVAVKEGEHRAMMAQQFPHWTDRIEYWHVDDVDCAPASAALPHLEEQIDVLIERLRSAGRNEAASNHAAKRAG